MNPAALLPFGPRPCAALAFQQKVESHEILCRSVAAGYWDGSLLSERGAPSSAMAKSIRGQGDQELQTPQAQALAGRLASSILPVLENATAQARTAHMTVERQELHVWQSESKMLDGLVGESSSDCKSSAHHDGDAQPKSLIF